MKRRFDKGSFSESSSESSSLDDEEGSAKGASSESSPESSSLGDEGGSAKGSFSDVDSESAGLSESVMVLLLRTSRTKLSCLRRSAWRSAFFRLACLRSVRGSLGPALLRLEPFKLTRGNRLRVLEGHK